MDCAVAPAALYELVADPTTWPALFGSVLDVRDCGRAASDDRLEVTTLVGGRVRRAVLLRRAVDHDRLTVRFGEERPDSSVAEAAWVFRSDGGGGSRVALCRRREVGTPPPRVVRWTEHDGARDVAALGRLTAGGHPVGELVFSFTDRVSLPVPADEAYDFVHRCDRWPDELPHVSRVALTELESGVQEMEMETVTVDGRTHTTRSVRLCRPGTRIAYKQVLPPALLLGHSGVWEFAADGAGSVVTSRHCVVIDPAAERVFGPGHTLADTRRYLRDALGANSRATLAHAGRATLAGRGQQ